MNTIARLLASLLVLVPSYLLAQTQQSLQDSPAPARPDLTRDTTLYALGYSHLDTQWRWDYQTTIRKYIPATMRDNFRLIEKYPGYTINFSGANRYMMMKEYYPEDFLRVKQYVASGRWFPAGSSLEESDALVPSPESLIRNILYGNKFFRREFGTASDEYLVPDCFGFSAALPSIFVHAGLRGFSTQKLTWGSAVGVPFNFGRWTGTDGSSVLAALNPGEYVTTVKENLSSSPSWLSRIRENGRKTGAVTDFMYFGTGDMGGAPAEESVEWVEKSLAGPGPIRVLCAPGSRFFDDLLASRPQRLPEYRGELLLTNHSAGSLTSQAYTKRWNRKNELLARSAEAAAVVAEWLGGAPYPREQFQEAWRLVVGAQFHDILAGTCTPRAHEFSWNDQVLALKGFAAELTDAVGAIARGMDCRVRGVPLVVFNPLSFAREDVVEATISLPPGTPTEVRVYDLEGHEVPSQLIATNGERRTFLFLASVPSVGFRVYDVRPSASPCALPTGLSASAEAIENARYRVTLNQTGDVNSIYDKRLGRELLASPHQLEFLYERPLEWPAWNMDWKDRQKPPVGVVEGAPAVRVVERGPVRVTLEVDRESRGSRFIQRIRLAAGPTGDRVEFDTRVHWFTPESSLKAAFPLAAANTVATYSTGAGTVERGNNNEKKFEVPSQQWFDLTDRGGDFGVSILEVSKFGSDKPADNILRLTLLFTPGVRGSYKDQASQDFGVHDMIYAVASHPGDWRSGETDRQAARLNEPLVAFQTTPHTGVLGKTFSFLQVSTPAVAVMALKKAEDEETIIVRLQETAGRPATNVRTRFAAPVHSAMEVNGQEETRGPANVERGSLVCDLSPFQIKAFALRLAPAAKKITAPKSVPLALPFTTDVISGRGEKDGGQVGSSGAAFPAELLPGTITSGGVRFTLGPTTPGQLNALTCSGQSLTLPSGNFNRLYLLAASANGEADAMLNVGGIPTGIRVGGWSGFVGQWDNRIWDGYVPREIDHTWDAILYEGLEPGYVRGGTIAHHTTHRHLLSGEDDPYAYSYLYRVAVDLPRVAKTVTLPIAPHIMILAASVVSKDFEVVTPATALHDTLNVPADQYARFQMTPRPVISPESCLLDSTTTIRISTREPAAVYYTLDGSTPTTSSLRYTAPLRLDRSCTVNASAVASGKNPSYVASAKFYKAYHPQGAVYHSAYSPKYRGRGDSTLFDGRRGTPSYGNEAWQGFEGEDCSVTLDLGQQRQVHAVTVGCVSEMGSWIFFPVAISVAVSRDGKDFGPEVRRDLGVPSGMEDGSVRDITVSVGGVEGRYVRVTAKNIGTCPPWHPAAGGKAWVFTDEIIVE